MAIAAIAAILSAVSGVASGVNKSASDQYAIKSAEYQSSLDYARSKEQVFYSAYANQSLIFGVIAVVGFIFIALIFYKTRT